MPVNSLNNTDQHNDLFLGIDGGGTKCKAIVTTVDRQILGSGIAGPANPLHGFDQATDSIIGSARLALKDAGLAHIALDQLTVGAGLAGINLPVLQRQMSAWQHPFKQMFLASDLLIACLGAHRGQDGAVMVTGTGSCGFYLVNDQPFMIGGHGFPQGDKGSGAWFGLKAVEQVLLSLDGLAEPTTMNPQLMSLLGCNDAIAIVEAIAAKPAPFFARLSLMVFDCAEQGDKLALAIVDEGAGYISNMAAALWRKNPGRMSILGGLAHRITPWLAQEYQDKLTVPAHGPEFGAVLFAQQQLALCYKAE